MCHLLFSELLIDKRSSNIDHIAKKPVVPEDLKETTDLRTGFFPVLDASVLNSDSVNK